VIAQAETEFNQTWYLESSERFRFMLILALVLHALLILALNFGLPDPTKPAQTLEVTLARFDDKNAPENADYLAQTNQQGSGESVEKHQPSTQERAIFDSEQAQLQSAMAAQVISTPAEFQPIESNSQQLAEDVLNETDQPLGLRDLLTLLMIRDAKRPPKSCARRKALPRHWPAPQPL
jgi:protein TonB